MAGKSVGHGHSFGSTLVDSGTTFLYLPPKVYAAVRDHFLSHCPWGTCKERTVKGHYSDDYCYRMSLAELDQVRECAPDRLHMICGRASTR